MNHRHLLGTLAAATLLGLAASASAQSNTAATPRIANPLPLPVSTDRMIVKYRNVTGPTLTQAAATSAQVAGNRHGVGLTHFRQMASGAHVMMISRRMTHDDVAAMAASLRAGDPNIEYAEPDHLHVPTYVPNDPMLAQQWHLSDLTGGIRATDAWNRSTGTGVTVAVIDTGVRPHADLLSRLLPGYDFITDTKVAGDGNGRDGDATDTGDFTTAGYCGTGSAASNSSWHGTHVAGIIAAIGNNGVGVSGVAFNAKILPLRALGKCGGYTSDIADAITWAVGGTVANAPLNPNPAKVINMSLGGGGACSLTTQNAINTARAKGAVVVVAAGNSNTQASTSSPANCSGVITVAATGKTGGKASYSNYGSIVSVAAPGGDSGAGILSTLNAGTSTPGADNYAFYMGTSMATPVVSGVAALMFAANSKLTPDQVAAMLKSSARAFPAACSGCGAGIVDANAAVSAALGTSTTPTPTPTPAPTPTPTPAPVTGTLQVTDTGSNDTVASAQNVASLPAVVTGSISSTTDTDYFKVTIPAGKRVVATLSASTSTSAFGMGAYSATGAQLLLLNGYPGAKQVVTLTNSGTAPVVVVMRVLRSSGAIGAYQLSLAY